MHKVSVFNPLDKQNLGESIVGALLASPARPLKDITRFNGAGVYAIYYHGSLACYKPLSDFNKNGPEYPIYVGKAIPKGGRRGAILDASLESKALFERLKEHKDSIETVKSLDINDFTFKCLVVDDVWISLGETLVIQKYEPLWNQVVEGFGNHDPGGGRYNGKRPPWDEFHPGRVWAARCQAAAFNKAQIQQKIAEYMARKFSS
jgi:hypothetical protein